MPVGTQGPLYPASGTDAGGSYPWASPQNISVDDGITAQGVSAAGFPTNRLYGQSYGFSIPGGATINGITVTVDWWAFNIYPVQEYEIYLLKAGVPGGTNKSASALLGFTSPTYWSYGNPVNLWGRTWTAADINAAGFGAMVATVPNGAAQGVTYCDSIAITVDYYTGAGGGPRDPGMIL